MESILELASLNSTEVILMVDFNCDFLAKRTYHQECKHLKSLFKTFNFTQFIDQPTRVSATSSTCLDLIATNRPYNIITYSVLPSCLSDHDTVYSVRKSNCRKAPPIVKV